MKNLLSGCLLMICAGSVPAQERGMYHIVSVSGRIVDQATDKALQTGDRVNLQTMLRFDSEYAKAVLVSPSKVKYRIELPESMIAASVLSVSSGKVLQMVKSRPMLVTGTRGGEAAAVKSGVSVPSLRDYFGTDTFTIVGSSLQIPVTPDDMKKYRLVIRHTANGVQKSVRPEGFTIRKADFYPAGGASRINACRILLDDGQTVKPVTQISLFFVSGEDLLREFDALLKALGIAGEDSEGTRQILKRYCLDIYGNMDGQNLKDVMNRYFDGK